MDPAPKEICVSLEGNGENFVTHFGAFAALMERDLEPVVIAGGSSGAPVAAIVRLLLLNPSLSRAEAPQFGTSKPRRAAAVLAASVSVFESLIFLPTLDDVIGATTTFAVDAAAIKAGLGFVSNPDSAFAHAEAITSQLILAAQFFANHDFGAALAETDFHKRVAMIRQDYIEHLDFIRVTPEQFVSALLTPDRQAASESAAKQNREIRRRYFFLFASNTPRERTQDAGERWQRYEASLTKNGFLLNDGIRKRAQEIYFKSLSTIRTLPFVGALAATIGTPFLLPSPEVLAKARNSQDTTGRTMGIPDGAIIHTTARLGEIRKELPFENALIPRRQYSDIVQPKSGKRIDDAPGFASLYQLYFTNPTWLAKLETGRLKNDGHLLFSRGSTGEKTPLLESSDHAQTFAGLNLEQALTATISEPGVFRRIPLSIKNAAAHDHAKLPAALSSESSFVITYGGWLDTSASNTLSLLPDCAPERIGHYAFLHPNRVTNGFQRNALIETNNRVPSSQKSNIDMLMERLGMYLLNSRQLQGLRPSIDLNWDWDKPITDVPEEEDLNRTLKLSRPLFFYEAYRAYRTILDQRTDLEQAVQVFGDTSFDAIGALKNGTAKEEILKSIFGSTETDH
jgi:hypothetical protein